MNRIGWLNLLLPVVVFLLFPPLTLIGIEDSSIISTGSPLIILDAILQAYPEKVKSLEIRNGDWSILIGDNSCYWAGGRLLLSDELEKAEKYSPYHFVPNPESLPPIRNLNPEETEQLKSILERKELHHDVRSSGFMTALWGMEDFITAENTVIRVEFLGYNIRIHPEIQNSLIQVEKGILKAVQSDEDAARWLDNISDAGAYVWRDIAGSGNRSLHSYGIALDLIPGDYQGKQAYWRWAADYYEKWWAIPYAERFHVPDIIVKIFEENGFVWGGKWFLFDQIHFEYRPELLILGK